MIHAGLSYTHDMTIDVRLVSMTSVYRDLCIVYIKLDIYYVYDYVYVYTFVLKLDYVVSCCKFYVSYCKFYVSSCTYLRPNLRTILIIDLIN